MLDNFLLMLFHKYAELLKRRFSDDFQEVCFLPMPVVIHPYSEPHLMAEQIVSTDDYMPMQIQSADEYEKVVNVSWFTHDIPISELT